jgi:hypothetical protein
MRKWYPVQNMSETLAERQKNSQLSDGGNAWRELGGETRCRSVSRHISSSGNFGQHAVQLYFYYIAAPKRCRCASRDLSGSPYFSYWLSRARFYPSWCRAGLQVALGREKRTPVDSAGIAQAVIFIRSLAYLQLRRDGNVQKRQSLQI